MSTIIPIVEFCKKEWPKNETREQWVATLLSLDPVHIAWKAPWMTLKHMQFGYGNKMWVPLLGLWRVVSYAHILICRQYASEQLIPATCGHSQLKFTYGDPSYTAQLIELSMLWTEPQRAEITRHNYDLAPRYLEWKSIRVKMQCF